MNLFNKVAFNLQRYFVVYFMSLMIVLLIFSIEEPLKYKGLFTLLSILTVILFTKIVHIKYKTELLKEEGEKNIKEEKSALAKFDKNFNITYYSPSFEQMIGINGGNIIDIYKNCLSDDSFIDDMKKTLLKGISFNNMIELKHGKKVTFVDTFIRKLDNSSISKDKYIMLCKDITPYIENQIKSKDELLTDYLTTLPNRMKFREDYKKRSTKIINYADTMIYIQLENYEEINEFFGFKTGLKLLKEFSKWIQKNMPSVHSKIYKFEHNSFAIYIPERFTLYELEAYLKSINHKINREFLTIDDTNHDISIRIGVARGKKNLLKNSYIALKEAQRLNKTYEVFNKKSLQKDLFLSNIKKSREIKDALSQDRVIPFFQPILNIKTSKVEKFESLMRIQNSDNSHQSPAQFLEISKKSRLYPELSKAMFKASLNRLEFMKQPITINLSIEDILDTKFSSFIMRKLSSFEYSNLLTFEILENEGIENYRKVASFIKRVKSFGCQVAIDDFGSGYSNFEQILKLDIDYIKIDGSLIKGILTNNQNEIIVKTIVNFAKDLNVKTIAEYVSSKDIFDKISSLGIDYAQGYYIGKPMPISKIDLNYL